MKRIAAILIFTVLLASACGGRPKGDPFSVFNCDFEARLTLKNQEGDTSFIYKKAEGKIEFLTPTELTGFVMEKNGGSVLLSYDGISVPLSPYSSSLMTFCESVFSATADDVKSITTEKQEGGILTVVSTADTAYRFNSDGSPFSVIGKTEMLDFELVFEGFTVTK